MKRALVWSVLLLVCVTGSAAAHTKSIRGVLVYAKATSTFGRVDTERIYRARIDGRRATLVGAGEDPAVSPDGRWIAFGSGPKIRVVPTAGGAPRTVYTLHKGQPSIAGPPVWAPDSRLFGVVDSIGLVLLDPGRDTAKVLPVADDFSFSPNSRRVAYEARGDIYVISARGGRPHRLTDGHKAAAPVW